MNTQQTVFVGLSGGVDSSVAALRLKNQGYNVVGVFIKVWHPDFMVCNWEQERLDAMRVAAHLDIPFLTCDAESAYRDEVATYFIDEYKAGRTPNPDVMCNQQVKFGAFLRFAKDKGADFIATGHYVQRINGEHGPELHRGLDTNKDQSYFLWSLTKEQLEYSLFPVGDTHKDDIRAEAEAASLPTAVKKDSQGICFLGHVDIPEFLSHYIDLQEGDVLDATGEVIGTHKGAFVYTIGQRHGFILNTHDTKRTAHFVVATDHDANTITVSETLPTVDSSNPILLTHTLLREQMCEGDTCDGQFRYRQQPFAVTVSGFENDSLTINVDSETSEPAPGQFCVLYRGSKCLGGGTIVG